MHKRKPHPSSSPKGKKPKASPSNQPSLTTYNNMSSLAQLIPTADQPLLLQLLRSAKGDVQAAVNLWLDHNGTDTPHSTQPLGKATSNVTQSTPPPIQTQQRAITAFLPTSSVAPCCSTPPEDQIREHMQAHCELFYDVLPADLAAKVTKHFLIEAPKTWEARTITVFDREVLSPRLSTLFATPDVVTSGAVFPYAGVEESPCGWPDLLAEASMYIDKLVTEKSAQRKSDPTKKLYSAPPSWSTNYIVGNYYKDGQDNTGFHSDTLTSSGPLPVIVSWSLGATRTFRLQRTGDIDAHPKPLDIALPHNSVLIMWPPCQEEWKHAVPPQKNLKLHPISGAARLNFTCRYFRQSCVAQAPHCKCNKLCVLRPVINGDNRGKYFYCCNKSVNSTCSYFQWLDPTPWVREQLPFGGEEQVELETNKTQEPEESNKAETSLAPALG
eukprot:TRINITY_DN67585_c3_g3_i1.p1 TRINITY_DN67585_c3_g3~~TRINITY_DN67585_c3_g3_i1.p1  ORF type:complete len:441 (-),score=65.97 TRINITY_DN67585_c3_g3_i1:93-1415(-)